MIQQHSSRSAGQAEHEEAHDEAVITTVVERNIQALLARRQQQEDQQSVQDRVTLRISSFIGSMLFVYLHLAIFGLWIAVNVGWLPGPQFDPSLVILAVTATIEAIFISTFVLITQNRMAALADKRADLDLQIGLLAEHEITRLLTLVTAIAEKVGVDTSEHAELSELTKDVHPEEVLDTIEKTEEVFTHQPTNKTL